jgi:hypothetical protein
MPGNRFAFAVEVGCEVDGIGLARGRDDFPHVLLLALDQLVGHREVVVRVDRAVLRGQVADMPVGRQDLESPSQIPVDGGFALAGDSTISSLMRGSSGFSLLSTKMGSEHFL